MFYNLYIIVNSTNIYIAKLGEYLTSIPSGSLGLCWLSATVTNLGYLSSSSASLVGLLVMVAEAQIFTMRGWAVEWLCCYWEAVSAVVCGWRNTERWCCVMASKMEGIGEFEDWRTSLSTSSITWTNKLWIASSNGVYYFIYPQHHMCATKTANHSVCAC